MAADELDQVRATLKAVQPSVVADEPDPRQRPPVDLDLAGITPIDWPELWGVDPVGEDWCVEPILPRGRQAGLFAPAGVGKSLLAVDLSAAKATGRPVLGQPAQDPVSVVYIDQEMTREDLRERLGDFGYSEEDDLANLHYYQLTALPPLDTVDGGDALMAIVERHRPELVVLDTMARVVAGDENSADTFRSFFRCSGCHLKAAGVALLRLDHAGKDPSRGQRGSSSKADDLDLVWRLSMVEDRVVLNRVKTRISYVPLEVSFVRETDPKLRHVLAPLGVPAGTAEVIGLLDKLDVAPDPTAAVAMRTLKAAGQGRRKVIVLAALKARRNRRFPESGNQAVQVGTDQPEPTTEPTDTDGTAPQVTAPPAVPGTNGDHTGTVSESRGTGFPLSRGEPVPDRPTGDGACVNDIARQAWAGGIERGES